MRRFAALLLVSLTIVSLCATPGITAVPRTPKPPRPPKDLPSFSAPQDVLNIALDEKILHVVSNDSLVTSVGSFPLYFISGGPGHRFAIRTTERKGSMALDVNAGCVGCGGSVGPVFTRVFGFETKVLPRTERAEKYEIAWNVPQGANIYTGVLSGDNARAGQASIPIDVLVLEKGLKLDFFEYEQTVGLKMDRFIGTARSLDDRVLNYGFVPKKAGFLLAVANMGTENVAIEGDPVEIRYVNEQEKSWPIGRTSYNPVNKQVIVPGTFALIDLSKIPDLKNALYVHFRPGKRVEVAWGLAALYKNTTLLYAVVAGAVILFTGVCVLMKKRKNVK